jgi:hypothetical protein
MAFAFLNGAIVRNNVVYNNAVSSIDMNGDDTDTVFNIEVKIYNNTVTNGISIGDSDGAVLRNNLVWNGTIGGWSSIDTDSDYNILFAPTRYPEGPHSIFLTETTGLVVDPVNGDFHLVAGSRAIDAGTDLTTTGFATDFDKVARPQGAGWDIGAYEWEN